MKVPERKLQLIFNILLYAKVLSFQDDTYTVESLDPFYISDKDFEAMKRDYLKHVGENKPA